MKASSHHDDDGDTDKELIANIQNSPPFFQFAAMPVKPFPTLAQQDQQEPDELFCCDRYRDFVQATLTHPLNQEFYADKPINVSPHPPHGSKLARKAAKERAAAR